MCPGKPSTVWLVTKSASFWTVALIQMTDDNGWGQGSRSGEGKAWSDELAGLLMECLCDVGEHCVTNEVKAFSLNSWKEMMLLP